MIGVAEGWEHTERRPWGMDVGPEKVMRSYLIGAIDKSYKTRAGAV